MSELGTSLANESKDFIKGLFKPSSFQIERARKDFGDKIKDIARLRWLYETAKLKDYAAAEKYLEDNNAPLYAWQAVEKGWNPDIATNDMVITDSGNGLEYVPRKSLEDDQWRVESTGDLITELMNGTHGYDPNAVEALVMEELGRSGGDYPSKAPTYNGTIFSAVAPRIMSVYGDDEKQHKRGGSAAAYAKAIAGDALEDAALFAGPGGALKGATKAASVFGKGGTKLANAVSKVSPKAAGAITTANNGVSKATSKIDNAADAFDRAVSNRVNPLTRGLAGAGEGAASVGMASAVNNAPGLSGPSSYDINDYELAALGGGVGTGLGRLVGKGTKRQQIYDIANMDAKRMEALGIKKPGDISREALDVAEGLVTPETYAARPLVPYDAEDVYFGTYIPEMPRGTSKKTFKRDNINRDKDEWAQFKDEYEVINGEKIPEAQDDVYRAMFEQGLDPESYFSKKIMNPNYVGKSKDIREELASMSAKKGYSNDNMFTRTKESTVDYGRRNLIPVNRTLADEYKNAAKESAKRYKSGPVYKDIGDKLKEKSTDWVDKYLLPFVQNAPYYGIPAAAKGATRVNWQDTLLPETED